MTLGTEREYAFAVFAALAPRWPPEYTWAGEALETIGIEPRTGGLCYERGPDGFECDWGRVIAWDPPARIVIRWQIGVHREPVPDPERASEVGILFRRAGPGRTEVLLEHRELERHGEGAGDYRQALASERGWPSILRRYAAAVLVE